MNKNRAVLACFFFFTQILAYYVRGAVFMYNQFQEKQTVK